MLEVAIGLLAVILLLILLAAAAGAGIWWSRRSSTGSGRKGQLVKRIELNDGQWAKVRPKLTPAMWDAVWAVRPHNVEQNEAGRIIDASGADVTDLVNDTFARAMVIAGVTEWSYGEVDMDVLDEAVPIEDFQTLYEYLDGVYASSPHLRRVTGGI